MPDSLIQRDAPDQQVRSCICTECSNALDAVMRCASEHSLLLLEVGFLRALDRELLKHLISDLGVSQSCTCGIDDKSRILRFRLALVAGLESVASLACPRDEFDRAWASFRILCTIEPLLLPSEVSRRDAAFAQIWAKHTHCVMGYCDARVHTRG